MPAPPYNFATLAATSRIKLFGGNIVQVPPFVTGAPSTAFQYGWIFQNFSSGQDTWVNWIQPQIKNWQQRGANQIRCILGGDYVLSATITQGALNAAVNTMIADIRSRGMTIGFALMAVGQYSLIGSPSAATIWAVAKSVLDNCIVPNQDVVAYFEPGNQESFGADIATNNTINATMKGAGYTCPIGASNVPTVNGGDFSVYTDIDLGLYHNYPQIGGFTPNWANAKGGTYTTIASANIPILVEESGYRDATGVYGTKADWLEFMLYSTFSHPSVVGVTWWGGQGGPSNVDGDWSLWQAPGTYTATAYDPTTVWADTPAASVFIDWGPLNRNATFPQTLNGAQAITGTQTPADMNGTTPIQHNTITSQDLGTKFWSSTPTSCVGTFSVTGDPGATYRVSYGGNYFLGAGWVETGHVDIVGSVTGQAINIVGAFLAGDVTPQVRTQRIAGPAVNGSLTDCDVTIAYGNAPSIPSPSFIRFGMRPSHLLAMGAAAAVIRNPRLTRRALLRGGMH